MKLLAITTNNKRRLFKKGVKVINTINSAGQKTTFEAKASTKTTIVDTFIGKLFRGNRSKQKLNLNITGAGDVLVKNANVQLHSSATGDVSAHQLKSAYIVDSRCVDIKGVEAAQVIGANGHVSIDDVAGNARVSMTKGKKNTVLVQNVGKKVVANGNESTVIVGNSKQAILFDNKGKFAVAHGCEDATVQHNDAMGVVFNNVKEVCQDNKGGKLTKMEEYLDAANAESHY